MVRRFRRGLLIAILCLVAAFLAPGCSEGIDCYNAFDRPPDKLLCENEFVFLGTLVSEDTLAHLGKTVSYEREYDNFLIQYAFRPTDDIKSTLSDTLIFVWYAATFSFSSGHSSGLPVTPTDQTLVYGDQLNPTPDLLDVLQPWVPQSMDVVREMLANDKPIDLESGISQTNLTLARRILDDTTLVTQLVSANAKGPVLYGTDYLYRTHFSFCAGRLAYCDSTSFRAYAVSSEEYLEALKALQK